MQVLLRLFWPLFIVTILHLAYISVFLLPEMVTEAGGLKPLDFMIFGYSFDEAVAFLAATQISGGTGFSQFHFSDDMIFPALYGSTLAIAIWGLSKGWSKTLRVVLAGTAIAAATIDYFENANIVALLQLNVNDISTAQIRAASTLTKTKFIFVALSFVILVIILLWKFVANSLPEKVEPIDAPEKG